MSLSLSVSQKHAHAYAYKHIHYFRASTVHYMYKGFVSYESNMCCLFRVNKVLLIALKWKDNGA
jgi:hypothetical protein